MSSNWAASPLPNTKELSSFAAASPCVMIMTKQSFPRKLLLTFDAFGTLFVPREPIAKQYGAVAARYGISGLSERDVETSFRKAFKDAAHRHPNYGKASGMKAAEWWANIINETFRPLMSPSTSTKLPNGLIDDLLTRFSSSAGYTLCPDVLPLLESIRETKRHGPFTRTDAWPWDLTVVGVVTNSDDRVPSILRSLGLTVAPTTVETSKQIQPGSLDQDISFNIMSYDVGAAKPDPQMLFAAQELLRDVLHAERLLEHEAGDEEPLARQIRLKDFDYLHVGDDDKDVQVAERAGWNVIKLARDGPVDTLQSTLGVDPAETSPALEKDNMGRLIARDLSQIRSWRPPGVSRRF